MVSGSGLVPNGYHNTYADGGWITDAGYGRLFSGFKFHTVYLALRPGTTVTSAMPALAASLAATNPDLANYSFYPPEPVSQITALREVRFLPIVLGIFLGLLAVGAVGHALATAVRRRALDLAVLRALGLTQRQCRWIVATQASVLAVIGLIFGVPLGLAVGRSVWRAVASYTPFEYVAPTAVWMLALIAPAALLIGNLLASWPGQRAARLRIATILRAE
jgi:ABC-type antimicrobial peptide transport system permease subunit